MDVSLLYLYHHSVVQTICCHHIPTMAPADGSMPATSRTEMGGLTTRTAEMKHGNTAFHSTWHEMDKQKSWGLSQWMLHLLDIDLLPPYYEAPVHKKTGKMPYMSEIDLH